MAHLCSRSSIWTCLSWRIAEESSSYNKLHPYSWDPCTVTWLSIPEQARWSLTCHQYRLSDSDHQSRWGYHREQPYFSQIKSCPIVAEQSSWQYPQPPTIYSWPTKISISWDSQKALYFLDDRYFPRTLLLRKKFETCRIGFPAGNVPAGHLE